MGKNLREENRESAELIKLAQYRGKWMVFVDTVRRY
jgi:hypothetical protein